MSYLDFCFFLHCKIYVFPYSVAENVFGTALSIFSNMAKNAQKCVFSNVKKALKVQKNACDASC